MKAVTTEILIPDIIWPITSSDISLRNPILAHPIGHHHYLLLVGLIISSVPIISAPVISCTISIWSS